MNERKLQKVSANVYTKKALAIEESSSHEPQSHTTKLIGSRFGTNKRKHFFTKCIINLRTSLPHDVLTPTHLSPAFEGFESGLNVQRIWINATDKIDFLLLMRKKRFLGVPTGLLGSLKG